MKHLNSLIFLGLMIFVAGCQKKEKPEPTKSPVKKSAQVVKAKKSVEPKKQGPTKLETKKSVAAKATVKKAVTKKTAPVKLLSQSKKAKDTAKIQAYA